MPATVDEQSDTNPIAKLSEEIDSLLAKYLELLDKYTSQRAALSETFNSLSQNLARANFHSKSGHRYGSDSYDQRMQATRTVAVTHLKPESSTDTGGVAVYTVSTGSHEKPGHAASEASGSRNTTLHAEGGTNSKATVAADTNENQAEEKDSHNDEAKKTMKKDPLLMFGIFSPPELKAAQVNAVGMVEDVIPQLLTVNEQMKDLEIKIRRAKKYRAREQAKEDALELARAKVFIKTAARNDLDEFDTEEHARLMIGKVEPSALVNK
ncbi:hypothetical protein BGZ60DRAFT_178249 [Tricladium varicosporioides]|nr:hypothetical protein BGZ60DRAFT_178249 [Hymenoscyphus varicosporioides]